MSRHRQRPPIVAILFLIAFLLGVLYFLGSRQLNNSKAHRLRLLAGFADRVESTVPDLAHRFETISHEVEDLNMVEKFVNGIPYLTVVSRNDDQSRRTDGDSPTLDLIAEGGALYLTYEGPNPQKRQRQVRARLDLEDLLAPTALPGAFESVLVAATTPSPAGSSPEGERGTVLFQRGDPELRLSSLEAVFGGTVATVAPESGSDRGGRVSEKLSPGEGTSLGLRRMLEAPSTASVPVRIAEEGYLLFVQPILIELPLSVNRDAQVQVRWLAGGFVSRDRLLSSSFTSSPVLLFALLSIFPLAVVSYPFLKLWLVSPRQRITPRDIGFLLGSTFLGCFLLTLLLLDVGFVWQTRRDVDSHLENLSAALTANLYRELGQIYRTLDYLDEHREAGTLAHFEDQSEQPTTIAELAKAGLEPEYPIFHSVFWPDSRGVQALKVALREHSVRRTNIRGREYFQCSFAERGERAFRLWLPMARDNGYVTVATLCLQSVISNTGGNDQLIVALPRSGDRDPTIMATRLASLTPTVVPPPAGFAIVDLRKDGTAQVLFHSDPRRILAEDLLKASDEDGLLAAMLARHRSGVVPLHYWGERHRVHVRPLPGLPWALVTFRGTQDLRLRNIELLYDLTNPFLLAMAIVALLLVVLVVIAPHSLRAAFWPDATKNHVYRWAVLGSLAVTGAFSWLIGWEKRYFPDYAHWLFVATMVLPLAALTASTTALFIAHRRRYAGEAKQPLPRWRKRLRKLTAWKKDRPPEPTRGWRIASKARLPLEICLLLLAVTGAVVAVCTAATVATAYLLVATILGCLAWLRARGNFDSPQRRWNYILAMTCLLFVTSVLPAVGLFVLAEERQMTLIVQETQERLAGRVEQAIEETVDLPNGGNQYFEAYREQLAEFWRETIATFFGTELDHLEPNSVRSEESANVSWPWSGWLARMFSARPVPVNDFTSEPLGVDLSRFESARGSWYLEQPEDKEKGVRLVSRVPTDFGTGGLLELRSAGLPTGNLDLSLGGFLKTRLWMFLLMAALVLITPLLFVATIAHRVLFIALSGMESRPPMNGREGESPDVVTLDDLLDPERLRRANQTLLVIGVPELALKAAEGKLEEYYLFSWDDFFRWADDKSEPTGHLEAKKPVILIGFYPDLEGGDTEAGKIRALESLVRDTDRTVVILAERDPCRLLSLGEDGEADRLRRQWMTFLGPFTYRFAVDRGDSSDFREKMNEAATQVLRSWLKDSAERKSLQEEVEDLKSKERQQKEALAQARALGSQPDATEVQKLEASLGEIKKERLGKERPLLAAVGEWRRQRYAETLRLLEVLRKECSPTRQLRHFGQQLLAEIKPESYETFSKEKMVSKISLMARAYYQAIWMATTEEERVVLAQLAHEGLVSPRNQSIVLDLMYRGLIVRDPELRLMNESFGEFIRHTVGHTKLVEWEAEEATSLWSILRWLLPVPLLLLGAFLFITQRDAASSAVGFVLAAASVAPTLVNLFGYFEQRFARGTAEKEAKAGA